MLNEREKRARVASMLQDSVSVGTQGGHAGIVAPIGRIVSPIKAGTLRDECAELGADFGFCDGVFGCHGF